MRQRNSNDQIIFGEIGHDYDIFSNQAEILINFWLEGKSYNHLNIEDAYQIIQNHFKHSAHYLDDYMLSDELAFFGLPDGTKMTIKEQLMYELLLIKATQHVSVLKALLKTGDKKIISNVTNGLDAPFWGGENNALGNTWMRVRNALSTELEIKQTIQVRNNFSDALMCFEFGLERGENIAPIEVNIGNISAKKIDNTNEVTLSSELSKYPDADIYSDTYVHNIDDYNYFLPIYSLYQLLDNINNSPPNSSEFPLHCAAYYGDLNEVNLLLQSDHFPDAKDNGGEMSEDYADHIHPSLKRELSAINVNGRTPLYLVCMRAMKALEGSFYTGTPTISLQSIPNSYVDIVHLLLEKGCNPLDVKKSDRPGEKEFTPIHLAIHSGNYAVTKVFREFNSSKGMSYMQHFLAQYGCNIRDQFDCENVKYSDTKKSIFLGGYPLLFQAIQDGDVDMVMDIFKYSKEFNINISNSLFSNENSKTNLIKEYLNNTTNDTPYDFALHVAARNGNLKLVKLLIEYGADVNNKNRHEKTAYDLADLLGHRDICEYLSEVQKKIDSKITPP